MKMDLQSADLSPYRVFSREDWAALRADTPLTMSPRELDELRGLITRVNMEEVVAIYLPLTRLLNFYVAAAQELFRATQRFLRDNQHKVPYIIGMAGSVAVGKSTTARVLQALLSRWPNHPSVALVTTDGFLFPNAVLERRGIMHRKGFPESYDRTALVRFLADVKAGYPEVHAPVYSHQRYDIVPGATQTVRQPDVVIVEGLNVLQAPPAGYTENQLFASDLFDYSIYVDADVSDIEQWYIERFLRLRDTVFQDPQSYFHRYASLNEAEARETAAGIWTRINAVNLRENILPTRVRAHLVLRKGTDHRVERVHLRRI